MNVHVIEENENVQFTSECDHDCWWCDCQKIEVDETAQKPQSVDVTSNELKLAAQQIQQATDGWFSNSGKCLAYNCHLLSCACY